MMKIVDLEENSEENMVHFFRPKQNPRSIYIVGPNFKHHRWGLWSTYEGQRVDENTC